MDCFVCSMILLIALGIAIVIAAGATYLIAVMMRSITGASVQTMLGAEAIALFFCACVAGALVSGMSGFVLLALLCVVACTIILAIGAVTHWREKAGSGIVVANKCAEE